MLFCKKTIEMFNEKIHAFPLLDVYEKLKEYKKADKEHRERLRTMLNHYRMFHRIKERIAESDMKSSLWWPCEQLEESLWESIRMMLTEHGYDPRWIRWKDGKAGLNGFGYSEVLPCEFDEILITFDGEERMEHPIPVRKAGKCGLVNPDGIGSVVCPFQYDLLFREPYADHVNYIAIKNGKYGIVDTNGMEIIPCMMDVIFERQDIDGILPLLKDGKWGIYADGDSYIIPKFDELLIQSEDYVRARIGDGWGWITFEGDLTQDQKKAFYGSWMDAGR